MRCSSTVSAPVQHCCAPLTAHHSRYIAVQLLTNQVLYFIAETKSRTKDIYTQICIYLAEQGMMDCELFGLATVCDGEYLFVDPDSKLSKYAPKNWKSSSSSGLDSNGKPTFLLHFRVQFYVESTVLLRDDITRHHYYLQLRENAVTRGQVSYCSTDELLLLLTGYALQADIGDYNELEHGNNYFQLDKYFPKELIARNSQITNTAVALHKENRGLTRGEAELHYIREASSTELSPLPHNLHLYKLKSHKKQEMDQTTVWLAICARGIQIYEETAMNKTLSSTFTWNNIGKLCFDRKKFEIRALSSLGEKLTYYTNCDEKSKLLLLLCRVTHQYSMTVQTKLTEVRRKEEEERKKLREFNMYARGLTSQFPGLSLNSSRYDNMRGDQRISVISNTSSNTTSGIVSDRVQGLDESEDDLEIEIMINSPPADSVESLALEHLLDQESSPDPQQVTDVDGEDVTDCVTQSNSRHVQKSSPVTAITPATTDGSQCSSSCSTVVIAGLTCNNVPTYMTKLPHPRRNSTTSSLELGYSHTAQNSAVSDSTSCLDLDLSVQSAQDKTDTTSSGIEPDLQTNGCSSETSGVYTRERANSNAGSFHGDGSDPSEAGKGSLLTPEELSDLIVGRNPGSYPLRATVSHTLDSDSDYVTLPPPPRPPPPFPQHLHHNYLDNNKLKRPTSLQSLHPQQQLLLSQQNLISQQQQLFEQLHPHPLNTLPSAALPVEEVNARFVTSRPHINILTAHSNISSTVSPCYASPTTYSPIYHSFDNKPHPPPGPTSDPLLDPGAKMKPNTILIGKNNYLDIHRSKNLIPLRSVNSFHRFTPLPPPALQTRQPPPPPPPLATVYTSQVTRSQIEQFKQQLYSDVDYVIYPLKDPAISKQEYMDVKQSSMIAAMASGYYPPPPPYPSAKTHVVYRSTPNVAIGSGYLPMFTNQPVTNPPKFSSNTNLSEQYYPYRTAAYYPQPSHYTSTSPLYSTASYSSSSSQSLRYEADYVIPQSLSNIPGNSLGFTRTRSDDNILNYDNKPAEVEQPQPQQQQQQRTRYRRLPPPPPPPPYESMSSLSSSMKVNGKDMKPSPQLDVKDIQLLREQSKNLDLPLISALCNDKSLIKQTNAFVMPKHPGTSRTNKEKPPSCLLENKTLSIPDKTELEHVEQVTRSKSSTLFESLFSTNKSGRRYSNSSNSKLKYPVSGLSTNQMSKPQRKTSGAHVHPNQTKSNLSIIKTKTVKHKDTLVP